MQDRIMDQKGFTLLEVLVAGAILTIGLLGIAAMMITAIQANAQGRKISVATNLTQQRIEEMKNIPFENLFMTDPLNSNNSSNLAPVNILGVTPVDNGSNQSCGTDGASGGSYPCGDVTTNDRVWTYNLSTTIDNITYRRIWTVQRNPDINGNDSLNVTTGINTDVNEQRTIRVEAIVSWSDATGKWHKITTASLIAG